MSNIKLFTDNSKTTSAFASLDGFTPRYELLTEVVRAEMSNLRQSNAHAKVKSEVSGGGKKPWKQKGTGRARHGSSRSPIWKGGGVTHGPRNTTNWNLKINKSARMCAIKSILSDRLIDENVYLLSGDCQKTKEGSTNLLKFSSEHSSKDKNIVIVYTTADKESIRGYKNTDVTFMNAERIQVFKLSARPYFVMTQNAIEVLESKIK